MYLPFMAQTARALNATDLYALRWSRWLNVMLHVFYHNNNIKKPVQLYSDLTLLEEMK